MVAKPNIRYVPAIDGLRAIAVAAVLLYHLGISWVPGGFLGVDLFFVISGYVITRVLLDSIRRSGGLDLRGFYIARARRLIPPLVFMIVTTALFVGVWAPETIKRFLTDIPFVFTGTMNWWLVAKHQDYFESVGRPPLLQHTWSLAVEAQFYLIWPLILYLVLRKYGRNQIPIAALAIAGISVSLLLFFSIRLHPENIQAINHIYFGTDTHSIGLFLGSALAVSWVPENLRENVSRTARGFIQGMGFLGLLGLVLAFISVHETDPTLYRMAFPFIGVFGCLAIASLVHPASRISRLLSSKQVLWIGHRSYAIYLWHWVIFQVTQPTRDITGPIWELNSLRILVVLALADVSYRWVELPTRSRAVELWFRGMKYRAKAVRIRQLSTLAIGVVSILVATSLVSANALSQSERQQSMLKKELALGLTQAPVTNKSADVAPQSNSQPLIAEPPTNPDGLWVTGDSVILGASRELGRRRVVLLADARVGRQAGELFDVIKQDKPKMTNVPIVLNLGNNNRLYKFQVVEIFEEIKNQPQIIVVNTAAPRSWRDENDALISQIAKRYPRITVVDWNTISDGHPEYFTPDGVHLEPPGVMSYVDAIMSALKG